MNGLLQRIFTLALIAGSLAAGLSFLLLFLKVLVAGFLLPFPFHTFGIAPATAASRPRAPVLHILVHGG